jgi:hypothetical protein
MEDLARCRPIAAALCVAVGRFRRSLLVVAIAAGLLVAPSVASAALYYADNWSLYTGQVVNLGQFSVNAHSQAYWRWVTINGNSSRISQNNCAHLDTYNYRDFPAGNTSWRNINLAGPQGYLYNYQANQCFWIRGRALSGNVINKDAQLDY